MRAGLLNEVVTILEPSITINEVGEQSTEYINKLTTKANVEHSTGNRQIENNEVVFNYSKTFKFRIYIDITELDRILWNNKQYRIISIEPNRQYQEQTVIAEMIND